MSNTDSTAASPSSADDGRPNQRPVFFYLVDKLRVQFTNEDKEVIRRVYTEEDQKYVPKKYIPLKYHSYMVPICIGTGIGLHILSRFKIIKKRRYLLHLLGGWYVSDTTGRITSNVCMRKKLETELASLDTPAGRFMRDNDYDATTVSRIMESMC